MTAPTRASTYSLPAVTCIFGTVDVSGYADADDVIELVEPDDLITVTEGADGLAGISYNRKTTVSGVLRLMETSRAHYLLSLEYEAFLLAAEIGPIVPGAFTLIDPNTGHGLAAAQFVFRKRADQTKGRTVRTREWPFTLFNPVRTAPAMNLI